MATKRDNFSDKDKARLYEQGKAICAFCGTDLWHFRQGMNPYADHDWADHIRPSCKGGGKLIDNGVTACSGCNVKKGDNTRDRDYLYAGGWPTEDYLLRFDRLNPVVLATLKANAQLHWTDWYFNRAVCHLSTTVDELWSLMRGGEPRKRTPTYWANAALKRVREWRRYYEREGLAHPFERGLAPVAFAPDHRLILGLFDCQSADEVIAIAHRLVPWDVGHRLFYLLKFFALRDATLADFIRRDFQGSAAPEVVAAFFTRPEVIAEMADDLEEYDIAVSQGDHLLPGPLGAWPALPEQRLGVLLAELNMLAAAKMAPWASASPVSST